MDGTISLGSVTLSAGKATLTTSALPAGVQVLTASYSGDSNFAASNTDGRAEFDHHYGRRRWHQVRRR